jgi:deoxycytidine triphosphate deaminase
MNEIYSITNLVNGKRYIGQTRNGLQKRKIEHLCTLRTGKHHNSYLQKSWDKYGEENFEFSTLEVVQLQLELNDCEKKWIALFNTIDSATGYNMNPGGCDSSSKEQYRKLMIFSKETGELKGIFETGKQCAMYLKCHTSSIYSALSSITRSVNGFFIRDFIEGVDRLDARLLKEELLAKKKRAGKISHSLKIRRKGKMPDRLLSTAELIPMITGELNESNIQNHSIDLNVIKIDKIGGCGFIPKGDGKTILPTYTPMKPIDSVWHLDSGAYNVEFEQGCNIPSYAMLLIRQRSSLLRNGGIISSSLWDGGFQTDSMGTVMILNNPIKIEVGARIATIYGHACEPIEKPYSGQWQKDSWRTAVNK